MAKKGPAADPRIARWAPVCEAVATLMGPYAEVVLHDIERDELMAIWNPMTRRRVGDPSALGELDELEPSPTGVYGPYEKLLPDGRRLTSVSALLPASAAGLPPEAMLCINVDRSPLEQAAALLAGFAAPQVARPESLFEQDWSERVNQTIGSFVRESGRTLDRLTRADRLAILAELDEAGVFAVRRSVPVVASALQASRSTVYALLAELKSAQPKNKGKSR